MSVDVADDADTNGWRVEVRPCVHCGAIVLETVRDAEQNILSMRRGGDGCPVCSAELYPVTRDFALGEAVNAAGEGLIDRVRATKEPR